jgi:hypothetical protein
MSPKVYGTCGNEPEGIQPLATIHHVTKPHHQLSITMVDAIGP